MREPLSQHSEATATVQLLNLPKALQLWGNLATYLPQLEQFLQQQKPVIELAMEQLQAGNYTRQCSNKLMPLKASVPIWGWSH